jgi:hypothetical protein
MNRFTMAAILNGKGMSAGLIRRQAHSLESGLSRFNDGVIPLRRRLEYQPG